jgi:hypothetical protein
VVRPPVVGRPPRPWRPGHPNYPSYRPGHWWRWATAGAITGWVVHRWANPIYYRYGSGGNVYYQDNTVYIDGEEYCSAEQYYQQASEIATSVPETADEQAEELEWMPLGVFALTAEGVNASSMYLQLALSKEGIIAGTFYNESTGATHPVEGMVDQETQRAAWRAADGTNPDLIMETGVYNLTENTADLLVHFGPEKTQEALLVRLDESERPEEEAAPASQGAANSVLRRHLRALANFKSWQSPKAEVLKLSAADDRERMRRCRTQDSSELRLAHWRYS